MSLGEQLAYNQLEKVVLYLDRNRNKETRDNDFHELTLIDPAFGETVLLSDFLDRLLDLVTKPDEQLAPELKPEDQIPDSGAFNHKKAYILMTRPKEQTQTTLRIIGLHIPLFEELKIDYAGAEKFPNQDHVIKQYRKSGKAKKIQRHHDFHAYNTDRQIRVILTFSDGRKIESPPIELAECKVIFNDLRAQGYSEFIPTLVQRVLQRSA